jgi:CPA2 family monovalent cation:H+ antiporter-2
MGVEAGVLPKTHYTLAVGVSLVTVLLAPLINRRAGPLLEWIEAHEPRPLRRSLETYHARLAQIAALPGSRTWWQRGRTHIIYVVIEALLVTGLLFFAENIYHAFEESSLGASFREQHFKAVFWAVLGLLTLVPLVGMGWSIRTLIRIFTESLQSQIRLPERVIGTLLYVGAGILVVVWLRLLVPAGLLSPTAWWMIVGFLSISAVLFSRRLISLRTQMLSSVENVLHTTPTAHVPLRWNQKSVDWGLNLQEITLPNNALCAGRTIAALQIRRRFGCTIVEINRQGYLLAGPEPHVPLFPGDRLLVLGSAEQIAAARMELIREGTSDLEVAAFDDAQLDTITVPDNAAFVGHSLRELHIPHRTGAVVVGISRDGKKQANPSGDEIVRAGDQWLVIGASEELRALRELLVETSFPEARPAETVGE